jgi:ribosomal-protein-alanine N-acetyltransferase
VGEGARDLIERVLAVLGVARPKPALRNGAVELRREKMSDWSEWARLRGISRDFLGPFESRWPLDSLTRGAFARRLRRHAREQEAGSGHYFLIFRVEDGTLLGGINIVNVRGGIVQSGTLGYWIGAPFARRGYMTDALRAMLRFAFDDLRLNRVEAACLPDNVASRRLLEKCGFAREGYARQYLRIDGRWQDHLTFAILKDDWDRSNRMPVS